MRHGIHDTLHLIDAGHCTTSAAVAAAAAAAVDMASSHHYACACQFTGPTALGRVIFCRCWRQGLHIGRRSTSSIHHHHHHWWSTNANITKLCHTCRHTACVPPSSVTTRRHMRAATQSDLNFPRTRTVTFGSRTFAVSGPTCWNSIPSSTKSSSLQPEQFRIQLKTTLKRSRHNSVTRLSA